MKNKKINSLLYLVLITWFVLVSCKSKEHLPKPEHISYNKADYNGFYDIGENGKEFKLLKDTTLVYSIIKEGAITLNHIKKATVLFNSYSSFPEIAIELDKKGTAQFSKLSKKNIHKNIAFIFNNKLFMCPIVNEAIEKGRVQITSPISLQETVNIVAYINKNCNR